MLRRKQAIALLVAFTACGQSSSQESKAPPGESAKPTPPADTTAPEAPKKPADSAASTQAPKSKVTKIPAESKALFTYLQAYSYRSWPESETATHPSKGPHSRRRMPVRVFVNAALAGSLKSKQDSHPKGAATVKEMFTNDGELRGWAVMIKAAEATGDDGQGWYWYEILSTTDADEEPVAAATAVGLCVRCHDSGADMILTDYPLK